MPYVAGAIKGLSAKKQRGKLWLYAASRTVPDPCYLSDGRREL